MPYEQDETTVLDILRRRGIHIPAPCGGNGTCGKCIVKIAGEDCLACQTFFDEDMEILVESEGEISVLSVYEDMGPVECDRYESACGGEPARSFGIAIDIGTTTLAFELLDTRDGARLGVHSRVNSQRVFGADVVTRIAKAVEGAASQLNEYIIEDIHLGISELLTKTKIKQEEIVCIAITGNTTMLHLLRNLPCDTLGAYPFTPVTVASHCSSFADTEVIILPGISAFVGADIVAGILFCGWPKITGASILIDLGTNGEMALFTRDKILATSTAAGPAFEAGNISAGAGSVPGAIARAYCKQDCLSLNSQHLPESSVFICETINNKPPVGICGTGVVDIAAQLVYYGLADETGRLEDASEIVIAKTQAGQPIVFTQKDLREVQLAKSAVRSGIEILLGEAGLKYENIEKVFLAGGFGYRIDVENAVVLGLIPAPLKSKVQAVGNAALGGCARVLLSRTAAREAEALAAATTEINLATHPRFNELFMEYMGFEKEL
ncbi:MAG: ASKHA domain-containing protein [Defluviitaleaceae bacterium]|nr:ASKHA domain-containing protein [Defluviitaleaceae bacterium]